MQSFGAQANANNGVRHLMLCEADPSCEGLPGTLNQIPSMRHAVARYREVCLSTFRRLDFRLDCGVKDSQTQAVHDDNKTWTKESKACPLFWRLISRQWHRACGGGSCSEQLTAHAPR